MSRSAATEGDLVTVRGSGPYRGLTGYVQAVDGDTVRVLFGSFLPQDFPLADLDVRPPPPPREERQKLAWREVLDDIDDVLHELSPEEREELEALFRRRPGAR